jgi:hypothetical protein
MQHCEQYDSNSCLFLCLLSKQRSRFSRRPAPATAAGEEEANVEDEEEVFDFARTFGVKYVRGGELFELRDEANVVLNDPTR